MRLAHLHLPPTIPFTHASHLQHILVSRLLSHKKLSDTSASPSSPSFTHLPPAPDPTILTFTPNPVYTTGRRDLPSTTTSTLDLPTPLHPIRHLLTSHPPRAEYHPTLRGGQTTYHGPGQLVAYTILDLRRLRLGPRQHIRLLERSVLDVLEDYGVKGGGVSEEPGVWVDQRKHLGGGGVGEGDEELPKKIAAVGVHLRRYVSSYGVGLNVTEEPVWFLRQIVACGLEGREATSLVGCEVDFGRNGKGEGEGEVMKEVAGRFVQAFVRRTNEVGTVRAVDACCKGDERGEGEVRIKGVYSIGERDVLGDADRGGR
ncbi:lipoyl(octanoyl) transferase [Helicocarpus griseus UAMH5409]|uniref:Octanoyltransferase n=1 Tax=Helicocarpus griseus UAMH5409 TaxID=1447875 RepID=A0A2B7WM47_9EURO|nr:lipoyl(octanoyl) transferase [Helicocarpus griseus UAMH5409]